MGYFRDNIAKAAGYVPGFQPSDNDVVKLNTNENPYPPSPTVIEAVGAVKAENLRKYPDPLADEFRAAAAEVNQVEPENIIATNGGDDLLTIAVRAFCDADRGLAYPTPTYSLYPVLANLQGCPKAEIPFDDEFNLPPRLAAQKVALTIVCNPNAPSGTFIDPGELASLADEIPGILLIDEAYVDFAPDNCAKLISDLDNVIILRSMSKGYSLAGVRFGYAIADRELIEGLMKVKDSYNVDTLAIAAATAAIKDQEHFRRNTERIKQTRAVLTAQLRALKLKVIDSCANFILVRFRKHDAADIYERLAEQNIYVRYFDQPVLTDKLRITVGTEEQNDRLLIALKNILSQ